MRRNGNTAIGIAALALAAALAAAAPAQADQYDTRGYDPHCAQQRQNRMVVGALIGGAAGAVLGNNVAARNAQTEGTVLGGALGAAAGAAIGRGSARCDHDPYARHAAPVHDPYRTAGYGYGYGASQPSYGYGGASTVHGYRSDGGRHGGYAAGYANSRSAHECRWGEQRVRDRRGRTIVQEVYLCRGPDGVWRAS